MGKEITEIAALLIGVALVALIIGQADKTSKVITSAGSTFGNLLNIVTLQSGLGTQFNTVF